MQRSPLPVDVVSTWWDYFVDGVGVVSGLATAGALIYAARTYNRHVELERRQQASKITFKVIQEGDHATIQISNGNESRVNDVRWDAAIVGAKAEQHHPNRWSGTCDYLAAFESRKPTIRGIPDGLTVQAVVGFRDASGEAWIRYADDSLHTMVKRYAKKYYLYEAPGEPLSPQDERQRRQLREVIARDIRSRYRWWR